MQLLKIAGALCTILILPFLACTQAPKEDYTCDCKEILDSTKANLFIVHAGGTFNGYKYTNSLEAINCAYDKGYRLFELDIMETFDNKFVAVHDWKQYKEITNSNGFIENVLKRRINTPLSEKNFSSRLIYERFTPMTMDMINKWFEERPDAILVTDKINSPKKFIGEGGFLFKDRLIMELFTWEAVEEALAENISAMPSSRLALDTENVEEKIDSLNIKYIAIARGHVQEKAEMLKRLKESGVKTYVFYINMNSAENEEESVWEKDMEYIHGMYVDNLDLVINLQ